MYDVEKIVYFLVGLIIFGNTCLLIGFAMTVEDINEKKRKRRKAKEREEIREIIGSREIVVIENEDGIIIEEFDDDIIIEE